MKMNIIDAFLLSNEELKLLAGTRNRNGEMLI